MPRASAWVPSVARSVGRTLGHKAAGVGTGRHGGHYPGPGDRQTGFGAWRERMGDKLARSSQVFLLGLLVACGIEVLVDWNATIFEINVLRDGMRQRGLNYASILTKAAVEPALAYDADAMDTLSAGLFEDQDVVFVRFTDQLGTPLYDRLLPAYRDKLRKHGGPGFRDRYAAQIDRDIRGILADPVALKDRIATSRHRDFVQAWNDLIAHLIGLVIPPAPVASRKGSMVYQDRLKRPDGSHDGDVTYSLGAIEDERGETWGCVLIAFSMDRTNAAITKKLLKGGGMTVFFVGLILVQSLLSRRDKLRLLDLGAQKKAARRVILDSLPRPYSAGGLSVCAALQQADGLVDGLLWDLHSDAGGALILVVDPEGEGVPAATVGLHVLKIFRQRRQDGVSVTLDEEVAALGQAALSIPLARPIGIMLLRVDRSGAVAGLAGPRGGVRRIGLTGSRALSAQGRGDRGDGAAWSGDGKPLDQTVESGEAPAGVQGPLLRISGTLPAGDFLAGIFIGSGEREITGRPIDVDTVGAYLDRMRRKGHGATTELAADASIWARGKVAGGTEHDVLVLLATTDGDRTGGG